MTFSIAVRLIGLLLSYWGYYRLLVRKSPVPAATVPVFVLSCQILLIFAGGLLGCMYPVAVTLYAGGLVCGGLSFLPGGRKAEYPLALWLLAGLMALAAVLVYKTVFTYNDDFSHWALLARLYLQKDAFATSADALITFPSYPPATACLIYYVCRMVTGHAACEWGMMMAQAALLFSCVIPLLSGRKNALWYALPAALVLAWFALGFNIRLQELMVDSVIPMLAFACIALIAHFRDQGRTVWEWMLMPMIAVLVLVKNSAIFFVVFIALAYLAAMRPRTFAAWMRSLLVIVPAAVYLLWRSHASAVSPNMEKTLHSMSGAWFKRVLSDKTMLDVLDTLSLYKRKLLQEYFGFFLCGLPMAAMALLRICGVRLDRFTRMIPWLQIAFFTLYHFGMICMYVLSMHITEASHLAQYTRYAGSILLLMTGMLMLFAFGCVQACEGKPRMQRALGAAAAAMALLCIPAGRPPLEALRRPDQSGTIRAELEEALASCPRGENLSYLLAVEDDNYDATHHYCTRYLLQSASLRTANVCESYEGKTVYSLEWFESVKDQYDYLIVEDHYPEVDAFIAANYPDQAGQAVIRMR